MRVPQWSAPFRHFLALLLLITPFTSAVRVIQSDSLNSCAASANETGFSASLFSVAFTPDNATLSFNIVGSSTISGKVLMQLSVTAYGYQAYSSTINPCSSQELIGACPLVAGQINLQANVQDIPASTINEIPGIAYTVPDLDGTVTIKIFSASNPDQELACLQADLSNGKTVYQKAVGWTTAVIAGLALLVSAIVSGLGHSNTSAHVAANALSLFGYFQTQALFGMTAVHLPPIVASWTQNFQWSLGIIHINFIQSIATWYQRSTGGTPSGLLSKLATTSVDVQRKVKRSADWVNRSALYLGAPLVKRVNQNTNNAQTLQTITIRGIKRVGFKANIEPTNIFMTGYIFFLIFVILVSLSVLIFKGVLELLARSGKIKGDKFQDFRNGWTTVLKGIMFRILLIGFPQMVVLCFWELTVRDSSGEVALAVITIVTMLVMLGYVCFKVVRIARRSITLHKNPAYILYSDPLCLHKWGFLYVQFKAAAYWFIIPALLFTLVIGLFVALAQNSFVAQAIGLLIFNAGLLVAVSILRPYMDKKINAFNIAIAAVNFVSSIFLLFFTEVLGVPPLAIGIMGVIFFAFNAIFALILLLMVLVATGYAIFSKNPDVRYQPMRDDRGSFIKSQTNLNTELDALGATARGESKVPFQPREIDADSRSSGSWDGSQRNRVSQFGSPYSKENHSAYDNATYTNGDRTMSIRSDASRYRAQNNASPWQRGAGYDR